MADAKDSPAATADEPTTPPEAATVEDGLTEEQRAVAEASEKPDVVRATLTALSREKRELERRAAKAESELRKRDDAERTELERATARAEEAEARAGQAERQVLVGKVAREHQLPPELAEALRGDTEDELVEHAKRLAKFVPTNGEPSPDLGSGPRPGVPATGSAGFSDTIRRRARR